MKHTRLICFLLILALVCGFVGCGGEAQSTVPSTTLDTQPPETQVPTTQPTETTLPPQTTEPFEPDWMVPSEDRLLSAENYFVYDLNAGIYLHASGAADTVVYPASITKLFSVYVACQYLSLDHVVTAGSELELIDPDSSVAGIESGDQLSVSQLIEGMLLPSGNDATYVLATAVGRVILGDSSAEPADAVETFVDEMNRIAQAVGMTGSRFATPDGIHDEEHYFTFADLVTLAKLCLANETVMGYAGTATDTVTLSSGKEFQWSNSNTLLHPESQYYCSCVKGLKTGQTDAAGSCLLTYCEFEDRKLLIGVFGCEDPDQRAQDVLQLLNETIL